MRNPLGPRLLSCGRIVATRQAVAVLAGRHPDQVRRHCRPVACDVRTRVPLYDVDEAVGMLDKLRRRDP